MQVRTVSLKALGLSDLPELQQTKGGIYLEVQEQE